MPGGLESPSPQQSPAGWVQVGVGRSWCEELGGTGLLSLRPMMLGLLGILPGLSSQGLGGETCLCQPRTPRARFLLPGASPCPCLELTVVCGVVGEEVLVVPRPPRLCCPGMGRLCGHGEQQLGTLEA